MNHSPIVGPAAAFRYCPGCGSVGPSITANRVLHCPVCDFRYFFNCSAATGAFVFHRGKLILGVRGKDPGRGLLALPGGFVDFGETVEDALRREMLEEMNLEAGELTYLCSAPNDYPYAGVAYQTMDLYYVCQVIDIDAVASSDEVTAHVLIAPADLDPSRLAFAAARHAFGKLLDWLVVNPTYASGAG